MWLQMMPSIFAWPFRVRFDECALDRAARASACLRYVIETAFAHSAHVGFPLAWYDGRGLHWLVRRVHLHLYEAVSYGALLTVITEVVGFRRIWSRRQSAIHDAHGRTLCDVTLDWIFTDDRGMPTRIIPEMESAFPPRGQEGRLEVEHVEIGSPPGDAHRGEYRLPAHQMDPRGHMNSAAYLELFEDGLVEFGTDPQQRPAIYELEYLRPLAPGEVLHRYLWAGARSWMLVGLTSAGSPIIKAVRREINDGS